MILKRSLTAVLAALSFASCDSGKPEPAPEPSPASEPASRTAESAPGGSPVEVAVERLNNKTAPHYHGPAMNRLRAAGNAAVPAILDFVKKKGMAELTLPGTMVLGQIKDDRLADLAVELYRSKDFFWRPAAMDALAFQARNGDAPVFEEALKDHLWGVRRGAIAGLAAIGRKEAVPALKDLLADEFYEVRGEAAKALYSFGDESGLPLLVDSLSLDAFWFDIDYGQLAREDAWKFLKKIVGEDKGFKPWDPPEERQNGLLAWQDWIAGKDPAWRDHVPETVRARASIAVYSFGYEIRSCQRGDFFLRLDEDWNLVLGTFDPEVAPLAVEERTKLDQAIQRAKAVSRDEWYGQTGCDVETYYLAESGGFAKLRVGLGGRPDEIEDLIDILQELIEKKFGRARGSEFLDKSNLFRIF